MFKNKAKSGKNNICGEKVAQLRKSLVPKVSQNKLAHLLQLKGLDIDKMLFKGLKAEKDL